MTQPEPTDAPLLAEQIAYYRAIADEYEDHALAVPGEEELIAAVDGFGATGDLLELACGPGAWTERLLRQAASVTVVDSAPEMLARAAARVGRSRVTFIHADLFTWQPSRRYDAVFFGFWLSHVPLDRFDAFWELIDRCLAPGGRVLFVDDGYRTAEELIEGEGSSTIERRLNDGTAFRAVKVPHGAADLEQRLAAVGWQIRVQATADGPFYWGSGCRRSTGRVG